jgi:hypothetical protein
MKRPKPEWAIYWIVGWFLLAFAIPEAIALVSPESGDTLTETLRYLFRNPLGAIFTTLVLGWLWWHILMEKINDDTTKDDSSG